MVGHLVKYTKFYSEPIPENPIELLFDIPKEELIFTISAINAYLKPIYNSFFDDSRTTQIDCIRVLFLDTQNPFHHSHSKYIIIKYENEFQENYNLFSRVTCLYALQEIINHNEFVEETPEYTFDLRERIFKFLLICNDKILTADENYKEDDYEKLEDDFFEFFMFRELHHNQYNEASNSVNSFYKSWSLFEALIKDDFFGSHFKNYLIDVFGTDDINEFFKKQIWSYFKSYDDNLKFNYLNVLIEETEVLKILDKLSERQIIEIPPANDLRIFDFLQIKKSPLFRKEENDGKNIISFVVMDNILFVEKTYSLLINDFWFDYLKDKEICNRKDWGDFIGTSYFEPFLEKIFNVAFSNKPNYTIRSTDALKFTINGNSIEYADFYIREKQNIILAEAKSNYLPMVNGYKTVLTFEDYKALDLKKFYKDYGLTQLAEKTIKEFHKYKSLIDDDGFNYNRKVQLYPLLIVNDPIFSSSYSFFVFKRKFDEMLNNEGINKKSKEHNVKPLSIINVSQLIEIEQSLEENEINIFNILDLQFSMSDIKNKGNAKDYNFLRTITHIIQRKVDREKLIPKRIRNFEWLE